MSHIRIHFTPQKIKEETSIKEKDIIHKITNVLRLKRGDTLFVFDGKGKEYEYAIEVIRKKDIEIRKMRKVKEEKFPQVSIMLAFPLLREQRVDVILQKATELGVDRFLPFFSQRGIIFQKPSYIKLSRWVRIVCEAARQSQRLWLPTVEEVRSFSEIVKERADIKLYAHSEGKRLEKAIRKKKKISVLLVVGPEGDFSEKEKKALEKHRFQGVNLSENTLRSETAAVFFVGLVNYLLKDKG